jgi:drug/metabolite transporter (DMT)-like permease
MRRLLVLAFIWGWSFLFIKVAVEGMSPPTVACARVGLGALVLVVVLRVRRRSMPDVRTMWRHFFVAAVFGNVIPFTLLAWGEQRITSALTAVLNASTPLFTAIIAAVYLKDRLRPVQAGGLLLGFAGVSVAAGFGGGDLAHSSVFGSLAAVLAGASYGMAFVYMRKHLTGIEPTVAAAGQLVMATALSLPLAIGTSITSGFALDPHIVVAIVLLGVFGTGLAYILNYRVIADLGATRASLVTYVIPVVAVTVGVVVLDEPFEWSLVYGGLLIVAGIALVHPPARMRRLPMQPVTGPAVLLVLVALVALPFMGCSSGSSSAACGQAHTEPLNPNLGHVIASAAEPQYTTDPPTSGPHTPAATPGGVLTQPLSRPLQVGALEAGIVLIQYRDLSDTDVRSLAALTGDNADKVVVAPNPDLPDRVVATAWLNKQTCSAVDVPQLRGFIRNHQGRGPGTDG